MDKEFYLNDIGILDWMTNDKNQIIKFRDRIEYKKNNQFNRIDGPAIEYFSSETKDSYYVNGEKISEEEFKLISKTNDIKLL